MEEYETGNTIEWKEATKKPNILLRRQRELRGWSYGKTASELQRLFPDVAVTAHEIGRWERGVRGVSSYYQEKFCILYCMPADQLGFIAQGPQTGGSEENTVAVQHQETIDTFSDDCTLFWTVPYRRNFFFTGREHLLTELYEKFISKERTTFCRVQAICGLGGIGKTQIAVEYAYRYRELYRYVLWIRATRETLISDFVHLAHLLLLPEREQQDQNVIAAAVKRWLTTQDGWLLIFDNVDDIEMIHDILPTEFRGHVLLTTRLHTLGSLAHHVEVEQMSTEEGSLLLLRRTKILTLDTVLDQAPAEDVTKAKELVQVLDGLPLALDQVGAYIEETDCSIAAYLNYYQSHQTSFLKRRGNPGFDHPESVATTFALSFEHVQIANPVAADLLRFCTFLAPDTIPEKLIVAGASHLGPLLQCIATDRSILDEAIGTLRRFSLVRRHRNRNALTIHRLVQAVLKGMMSDEERQEWANRAVRTVNSVFSDLDPTEMNHYQQYLSHAQACIMHIGQWNMLFPEAICLLNQTGICLKEQALYKEAEIVLQRSLAIREQLLGSEHIDVAISLNNLALLYHDQGKYVQAEPLYTRALAIHEKNPISEELDIAILLNNLALLSDDQGKYFQAEARCQRALDMHIDVLGPKHPHVAMNLNNLAGVYRRQGKYTQAEFLLQQALTVYEQSLGSEHLFVALNLDNIAGIYRRQGRYTDAELLFRRALTIREQIVGRWHPEVATSLSNLAVLYDSISRFDQAEPLYKRALAIYEQVLSLQHPYVAVSLSNFAIHYYSQGNETRAKELIQSALEIDEQALGAKHPSVANDMNVLAVLYCHQGNYDQAEALHKQAQTILERSLGFKHSQIAHSLNNLAVLYHKQGKYTLAKSLYQQALVIYQYIWGLEHTEVVACLNNLAKLYHSIGCKQEEDVPIVRQEQAKDMATEVTLPVCPSCKKELSIKDTQFCYICGAFTRPDASHHQLRPTHADRVNKRRLLIHQQSMYQPPSRPIRRPLQQAF